MRVADVGGDLLALHHALAFVGERLFLARLDRELCQLIACVARVVCGLFGFRDFFALAR